VGVSYTSKSKKYRQCCTAVGAGGKAPKQLLAAATAKSPMFHTRNPPTPAPVHAKGGAKRAARKVHYQHIVEHVVGCEL